MIKTINEKGAPEGRGNFFFPETKEIKKNPVVKKYMYWGAWVA